MHPLLVILGPTASGKTNLACEIAAQFNGEIISADSRQVYRRMDIGTGKDIEEYQLKNKNIPYHLIDIAEPGTKYHLGEFQLDFIKAYNTIISKSRLPILCGGSGLYLDTAIEGQSFLGIEKNKELRKELEQFSDEQLLTRAKAIRQDLRDTLTVQTRDRKIRAIEIEQHLKNNPDFEAAILPDMNPLIIGVSIGRELRREKITQRLKFRLKNGMMEEVENLLNEGVSHEQLEYYGLEYKWLSYYLQGKVDYTEMFTKLNIAIHQFAKRQMTWYRGMERRGHKINWIDTALPMQKKIDLVNELKLKEFSFNQ